MEQENLELRKMVAALTNSNDHLRKEVIKKEVRIIILEKNLSEMEGDRSCLLRQHIGTMVENKGKVADLKKDISEKTKEIGELKESFKNEVQYKTTIADLKNQIVAKNDKNEKLSRTLENTRLIFIYNLIAIIYEVKAATISIYI